ncbi:MAG: HAD-IC family P-type ATPase [Gammaproteobacteria bacterium]|nr:HAD-IC family P-type ATPase [Gammaproteobacteria bacterium]
MNARPAAVRAAKRKAPDEDNRGGRQRPPAVAIVHTCPGRTRLRIPALVDCDSREGLEQVLVAIAGVRQVTVKPRTRSVLAMHDRAIPAEQFREQAALALLGLLPGSAERPARKRPRSGPAIADETWHEPEIETLVERFATSAQHGLTSAEVHVQLGRVGPNRLEERPPPSTFQYLARQVTTAPVALLAGSAVISVATGGLADAIGIGAAIAINAAIGAMTEQQSEKTIRMLSRRQNDQVRVVRDGHAKTIGGVELVPGDLLLLSPGDLILADARLLTCNALSIDESALTGESLPVEKSVAFPCDADTPLADRLNMVFSGTTVTGGSGTALVVATAYATEVGRIQLAADSAAAPETPMQTQLNELGGQLTTASLVACGAVLGLGLLRGGPVMELLKTAISLGVAAVPEGLPAVATTTLAIGVRNMREQDLLIRNINAVETLGSVETVCLDKTGTLTENRMAPIALQVGMQSLRVMDDRLVDSLGHPIDSDRPEVLALLRMITLCNDSTVLSVTPRSFDGAATENALLELALIGGLQIDAERAAHPRVDASYRSESRPWMYTVHQSANRGRLVVVKGSPAEVLSMCNRIQSAGRRELLTAELREEILAENEAWGADALRVLGVACDRCHDDEPVQMQDLTWLGLVAVADPLRQGMRELISGLHDAGVATVMITGDQMGTAAAIGRQLQLNRGAPLRVLDSRDLTKLDPTLLDALVRETDVFARVSPANKLQIVRALQHSGQVVAMTGDGVNDGPALKAADVGIAMGQARNEVARSVADVVVKENDLESVIAALAQGRATYANVRKALHYLISTNLSEIEVMVGASLFGLQVPLTPIQLLWMNLVTDALPALALALEPAEPGIMQQPPRRHDEPIVTGARLKQMLRESGFMTAGTLGSLMYGQLRYGDAASTRGMTLNTLVAAQLFQALSCRRDAGLLRTGLTGDSNRMLLSAVGGTAALQVLAMSVPPLRRMLQVGPLGLIDLLASWLFALGPMLINDYWKGRLAAEAATEPHEKKDVGD